MYPGLPGKKGTERRYLTVSEQYREYNDDEILLLIDGMSKEELKDMFEQHNMEAQEIKKLLK